MRTAIKVRATVLPGHRIEIAAPDFPEGACVDVIVRDTGNAVSAEVNQEQASAIDALSMRGPAPSPEANAWLSTVGKAPKDSSLIEILDEGARLRAAESDV